MKIAVLTFVLFLCTTNALAEAGRALPANGRSLSYLDIDTSVLLPYDTPGPFEWISATPGNLMSFGRRIKPMENYAWLAGIAASSVLLIRYDQQITRAAQKLGRDWGMVSDTKTGRETITLIDWQAGGYDLPLVIPANATSTMYFLGDGLTHLGIVGGLLGYGFLNDDSRSISTASQTAEALLLTGIVVQVLKRTTGREAAYLASEEGGKWQWFPNQEAYNQHVPQFDAFPSGHLATVMATTKVLADNYPDHRYIWPVGAGVMTLLGFAMLTNGVHWAGDYPLGLAIGYVAGQVAVDRDRKKRTGPFLETKNYRPDYLYLPFHKGGASGVQFNYGF